MSNVEKKIRRQSLRFIYDQRKKAVISTLVVILGVDCQNYTISIKT